MLAPSVLCVTGKKCSEPILAERSLK